jgi:hypothetical protein
MNKKLIFAATWTFFCLLGLLYVSYGSKINLWASRINPQTLEFYKALSTVAVALIAAGIASIIQLRQLETAEKQRRIAQQKLNFDLFDRRLAVYDAAKVVLDELRGEEGIFTAKIEFRKKINGAEWIFNEDLSLYLTIDYLEVAGDKVQELNDLNLKSPRSEQYYDLLRAYSKWGDEQYMILRKMFTPYLKLDQV